MKKIKFIFAFIFASFLTFNANAGVNKKEKKETKTETVKNKNKAGTICSFDFYGSSFNSSCGRCTTYHVTVIYWCETGVLAMPTRVTTASCESSAMDFNFA